jgi:hypothetical protein
MDIEIPYEFEQFVKRFYPGSNDGITSHQEWIGRNLAFVDALSRDVIRRFLDELLSERYTDADIEDVWRRQSPSYDFSEGGHRFFLTEVRDLIGDR